MISKPTNPLLKQAEQATAAALLVGALGAMAVYWAAVDWRGGVIDIDRAPPRRVEFLVDLNRAEWPELTMLPGVGETLARRIVESRQTAGPFNTRDDLQRVRGIGPRTVERIGPYLAPLAGEEVLVAR